MNLGARVALCITCWGVAMPVAADAGTPPWVFVPVARGGLPVARAAAVTAAWEAELVARGERVIPSDDAAEQVRAHSVEPLHLDAAEREAIARRLNEAQGELAVRPAATTHVLRELSPAQRDAVAQDTRVAAQMEAICLTQLEYQIRSGGQVHAQAQLCRELFPALRLDGAEVYPAEVRDALNAVARVDVRVEGPVGCQVLLNGTEVGVTPAALQVFPVRGRVQLICDRRATRVHPVMLGERKRIAIDPAVDAGLRTDRGLYVVGDHAPAATLGRWLGARIALLEVQIVEGRIRVQVVSSQGATAATPVWFDLLRGYNKADLTAAVGRLLGGRPQSVDAGTGPMLPALPVAGPSDQDVAGGFPLGPVLLGSGGVALLAGSLVTGLLGAARDDDVRAFAQSCPSPCSPTPQQRSEIEQVESEASALYTASAALAVGGSLALVGAVGWFFLWDAPAEDAPVAVVPWGASQALGADVVGRF